jgi:hypothetical protein
MDSVKSKKREMSALQKVTASQKRMENLQNRGLPSLKEAIHLRTKKLALEYLSICQDENQKPMALSTFCKKRDVCEKTMRKTFKTITGETKNNVNPNSNNIVHYQKRKKDVLAKVALHGIDSLSEEESIFFSKVKDSEEKRLAKLAEKRLSKITTGTAKMSIKSSESVSNLPNAKYIGKSKGSVQKGGSL